MANNNQDLYTRIRGLMNSRATRNTEMVDQQKDEPMSAQEVQQVVGANQAASQMGTEGLFTGGLGQTGRGAWYSMLGPGNAVTDYTALAQAAPGPYVNQYRPAINQVMNGLLNAQPFSYDVNADGLYQQIKDNYLKAARQGMMDTQAQSAALTGGYGNSYGAQAGQQAYQESLGNLTAMVPELYQMAYQRYLQDRDDQRNNLEAMYKLEGQDYARWLEEAQNYQQLMASLPAMTPAASVAAMMHGYEGPQIVAPTTGTGTNMLNPDEINYALQGIEAGVFTLQDLPYIPGISQSTINYLNNRAYGLYTPDPTQPGTAYNYASPGDTRHYSRTHPGTGTTGVTQPGSQGTTGTGTPTGTGTQTVVTGNPVVDDTARWAAEQLIKFN